MSKIEKNIEIFARVLYRKVLSGGVLWQNLLKRLTESGAASCINNINAGLRNWRGRQEEKNRCLRGRWAEDALKNLMLAVLPVYLFSRI